MPRCGPRLVWYCKKKSIKYTIQYIERRRILLNWYGIVVQEIRGKTFITMISATWKVLASDLLFFNWEVYKLVTLNGESHQVLQTNIPRKIYI